MKQEYIVYLILTGIVFHFIFKKIKQARKPGKSACGACTGCSCRK